MSINNKSVLGSAFDDFVQNQLKIRSKKLSSLEEGNFASSNINRDTDTLNATIGKTAFLRLTSGVDVDRDLSLRLFNNPNYAGSGLAKNFILQGGTLNAKGGLRGGVSGPNSAYTVGGIKEFGLRPMPGIISANVVSKGRWGSLREASINIKCFNRDQLSAIELLYMRPGYTILLEWGHTVFHDNNGNLITNVQFIDFFQKGVTRNEFYKDILRKQKQYHGNFDCFIGPVRNFNLEQNGDGSYDITINALSWGSIIESLKINSSAKFFDQTTTKNNLPNNDQFSNDTGIEKFKEEAGSSKISQILNSYLNTGLRYKKNQLFFVKDIYQKDMDPDPTGHSVNLETTNVNSGLLSTFTSIAFKVSSKNKINSSDKTELDMNVYMPLGSLLAVISKNCLLYNTPNPPVNSFNLLTNNIPDVNYKDPIININFNTSENYCFSPDYHISIDPSICLIKYNGGDLDIFGLNSKFNKINPYLPTFKSTESRYTGNTMNIMVNINYILNTLSLLETNNENREVFLQDFLEKIMIGINTALGNVNQFNVGIDEETNTVTIYDKQILDISSKEISIIPTTGLKSTVRKITINTRLSNQLGSWIAIGAAASGVSIGTDASVLSQYNKGLTDRFISDRDDIDNSGNGDLKTYLESLKKDKRTALLKKTIENIYQNQILISDDVSNCKNIYSDIMNTIKAKDIKTQSSTVIPFTYNIKMDGISGIKYGQMFSIEPSRLPKSYLKQDDPNQPFIGFLIYNIDHEISNNTWLTEIKGQAAPLHNSKIKQ